MRGPGHGEAPVTTIHPVPSYRISQAARLLGVSPDTVRRWGDSGRLGVTRDEGGRRWVDGAQLAALAASLAEEAERGPIRYSTRNRLTGIVTKVTSDPVMSQVELVAGPFRMVSLISTEAVNELGLDVGVVVVASVKATNVSLETPRLDIAPHVEDSPADEVDLAPDALTSDAPPSDDLDPDA
jgi:molybdopterin-binding protein